MKMSHLLIIILVVASLSIISVTTTINYLTTANKITGEDLPITVVDVGVEIDDNVIYLKKGESKIVTLHIVAPLSKAVKADLAVEPEMTEDMDAYKYVTVIADRYTVDIPAGKGKIIEGRGDTAIRDTINLTISVSEGAKEGTYTYSLGLNNIEDCSYGPYLHIKVNG